MLSIGEFSTLTGLSVKALHHYDTTGVLPPADVDPVTRYRRYGAEQVRTGVQARTLRDAGVPLTEVAAALADGDPARALAAQRRRVLAEREREDRAHAVAERTLAALARPAEVRERHVPAQPYAGHVLMVRDGDDVATADDAADARFTGLARSLHVEGVGPAGQFWTTMRRGPAPDAVELLLWWPTSRRLPTGWGGPGVEVGEMPGGTELVVRLPADAANERADDADDDQARGGALHPAAVALFDAVAARGLELTDQELRQTVVDDPDGGPVVELAVRVD